MNDFVIFLTGCINVNKMAFTVLQDAESRKKQYIDSISWYLQNTKLPILFVENSGVDLTYAFIDSIKSGRLEILTFNGNDYDRSLGKGYGEALLMKYGIENSSLLQKHGTIVKITGRIKITNINELIKESTQRNCVYCNLIERFKEKDIFATSRFVIAPLSFIKLFFFERFFKTK